MDRKGEYRLTAKWTIQQIKQYLQRDVPAPEILEQLSSDQRAGVQKLLRQYYQRKAKEEKLEEQFLQMSRYERTIRQKGITYIAGVDEVGRGPLAGPVVAAAVILPDNFKLLGLNDSKKISRKKRELYYKEIIDHSIDYSIGSVTAEEIDQINILQAAKKAMYQAIHHLSPAPEWVLLDAVSLEKLPMPNEAVIKGDQKSISIAAASIIAKVTRDNWMETLNNRFPMYKFDKNNGYGTKEHIEAIKSHGLTPYHRKTFLKSFQGA